MEIDMPLINVCQNFDVCRNPVTPPEKLCADCKRAAKQLERAMREDEKIDRRLAQLERKPRRPSEVR
jgi:hypothetical protein